MKKVTTLKDYLDQEKIIAKTIRAEETLWEDLEKIAKEYGYSVNYLVSAMLLKGVHDHFKGKE